MLLSASFLEALTFAQILRTIRVLNSGTTLKGGIQCYKILLIGINDAGVGWGQRFDKARYD